MTQRRVDRIAAILERLGGRARVRDVLQKLRSKEHNDAIAHSAVSIAINAENERLEELGERPRFRTSKSGEEWGWVRLETSTEFGAGTTAQQIETRILEANRRVDEKIRKRLTEMDWVTFESGFLTTVLERLGFQDVEITQPTRDGGADARVSYKRGIVEARAIVSAKRWQSRHGVPVTEVRQLRGMQGDEDTAIIITTGRFTADAEKEARPSQNQRVVYLIDGDRLVQICKRHEIGVKKVQLQPILVVDDEQFQPLEDAFADAEIVGRGRKVGKSRHFHYKMLSDIPYDQLGDLLGLSENTVKSYMSIPDRKRDLADRIRADPDVRKRALRLVDKSRGGLTHA